MTGYTLHMLSFKAPDTNGYNVAFGNGANLQPWHLDVVEAWLKEQRAKQIAELLERSNEAMENIPWRDDGSDLV